MRKKEWKIKNKRFVAFFDIMGFKNLVMKSTHDAVAEKLNGLKSVLKDLESLHLKEGLKNKNFEEDQTKSMTFSDSIIIFSKGDTSKDAYKILIDSLIIMRKSFEQGIAIKGAFSYGEISVDHINSLFFGQPIIDASLLHDELQMYTVIADHNFEAKINSFGIDSFNDVLTIYKAVLKSGKISHKLLRPINKDLEAHIGNLNKIELNVSGKPRIYVDNTRDFLNSLLPKEKNKE